MQIINSLSYWKELNTTLTRNFLFPKVGKTYLYAKMNECFYKNMNILFTRYAFYYYLYLYIFKSFMQKYTKI